MQCHYSTAMGSTRTGLNYDAWAKETCAPREANCLETTQNKNRFCSLCLCSTISALSYAWKSKCSMFQLKIACFGWLIVFPILCCLTIMVIAHPIPFKSLQQRRDRFKSFVLRLYICACKVFDVCNMLENIFMTGFSFSLFLAPLFLFYFVN